MTDIDRKAQVAMGHFFRHITDVRPHHFPTTLTGADLAEAAPGAYEGEMPEGLELLSWMDEDSPLSKEEGIGVVWRGQHIVINWDHDQDARNYRSENRFFLSQRLLQEYARACTAIEARGGNVNQWSVDRAMQYSVWSGMPARYLDLVASISVVAEFGKGLSGVHVHLPNIGTLELPDLPGDVARLRPLGWTYYDREMLDRVAKRQGSEFGSVQVGVRMGVADISGAIGDQTEFARWVAAGIVALHARMSAQSIPPIEHKADDTIVIPTKHTGELPEELFDRVDWIAALAKQARADFPGEPPFVHVANRFSSSVPNSCVWWRRRQQDNARSFYAAPAEVDSGEERA